MSVLANVGSSLVMYAAVKASPPSASPRDLVPLFGLLLHLLLPLRTLADDYRYRSPLPAASLAPDRCSFSNVASVPVDLPRPAPHSVYWQGYSIPVFAPLFLEPAQASHKAVASCVLG